MFNLFASFETQEFPQELCVVQSSQEKEVLDCHTKFLCVLVDPRFPQECRMKVLQPYTCPDFEDPTKLLYGWTDGQNAYDHCENYIHDDYERVVAWRELDTEVNFSLLRRGLQP